MGGRYIGLYRIDVGNGLGMRYVTIMRSVFDTPLHIEAMYDLKGSSHNREVKKDTERVKKDVNFVGDGRSFKLTQSEKTRFQEVHRRDTDFLSKSNVMDYSMLVGFSKVESGQHAPNWTWLSEDSQESYTVGIIDFLVEFGVRKRLEHGIKKVRGIGDTASVTEPAFYSRRQQDFVAEHILRMPKPSEMTPVMPP